MLCAFVTTPAVILAAPAWAASTEDLMAADRAFSQMSAAKGHDAAFLAFITEDARLFGTGGEPLAGKAAAAKEFAKCKNPKATTLTWEPDTARLSADGAMGWTDGHWRFVAAKAAPVTGHYLTVWVKQKGAWKVQADMGTLDPKPKN
jgi:ketosteroid isomerase-like protein